jgi:hypothetical protein
MPFKIAPDDPIRLYFLSPGAWTAAECRQRLNAPTVALLRVRHQELAKLPHTFVMYFFVGANDGKS